MLLSELLGQAKDAFTLSQDAVNKAESALTAAKHANIQMKKILDYVSLADGLENMLIDVETKDCPDASTPYYSCLNSEDDSKLLDSSEDRRARANSVRRVLFTNDDFGLPNIQTCASTAISSNDPEGVSQNYGGKELSFSSTNKEIPIFDTSLRSNADAYNYLVDVINDENANLVKTELDSTHCSSYAEIARKTPLPMSPTTPIPTWQTNYSVCSNCGFSGKVCGSGRKLIKVDKNVVGKVKQKCINL